MNPPAKLVAFLTLLAAVFGVSYVMGTQSQALLAPVPTHNYEMGTPPGTVQGYALRAVEPTQKPGKDVVVEFAVSAPGGQVMSELDHDAGEHMHLIVFRRDLTGYQHLTAQQGEGTSWWGILNLTPGPWHVIIHFQSKALGREIALATDFTVSGKYRPEPLPPGADQVQVKGLTVTRTGELSTSATSSSAITVTDDGRPVTDLQPAHGEMGHSVLIRPADLGYLHMHSNSTGRGPRLDFLGAVPDRGSYRLFVEFYRGDKLYLAPFTVEVTR
ncbi:MAG TPA: hypothetical protein VF086_20140 [Propionibacteriaceae bacterium]